MIKKNDNTFYIKVTRNVLILKKIIKDICVILTFLLLQSVLYKNIK